MKKTKHLVIIIIIFFSLVIISYFFRDGRDQKYESYGRYTIGTTDGIYSSRGIYSVGYYFYVNNTKYTSAVSFGNEKFKRNKGRYLVVYLPDNLEANKMLLNMPVPDTLRNIPEKGWSKEEFESLFGKEIEY